MPQSVPNYLTIDPTTGQVGADFTGHIHARGLDLDAGTTASPPTDRRVRWIDTGGQVVAEIFAYKTPTLAYASLQTSDGPVSTLETQVTPGSPANTYVRALVDVWGATILDGDGESSFLQLDSVGLLRAHVTNVTANIPAGPAWGIGVSVPWTINNFGLAILSVIPASAYGFIISPRVTTVNSSEIRIDNNPVTQDISVNYLTLGQ